MWANNQNKIDLFFDFRAFFIVVSFFAHSPNHIIFVNFLFLFPLIKCYVFICLIHLQPSHYSNIHSYELTRAGLLSLISVESLVSCCSMSKVAVQHSCAFSVDQQERFDPCIILFTTFLAITSLQSELVKLLFFYHLS